MAILRLMTNKRTLGFKKESTPYTVETLAAADYDFSAYEITYSPEIAMYARRLAKGNYSRDKSIAGQRKGTITFKVDLHSGDAAATAPKFFDMLECCGMKKITYGATGVELITDSAYDRVPATIEVTERQEGTSPKQLVIRLRGAMGNARLVLSQVGQPIAIEFEFTGVLDAVTTRAFASIIVPTGFDANCPPAVLSATMNLYGTTQYLRNTTIDLGGTVEVFSDPSKAEGFEGARLADRLPTVELDPDMLVTDDIDHYTNWTTNNEGQLSYTVGSNIVISAPAAQIQNAYQPGDAEGHVTNQLSLQLNGSVGNDELSILQGNRS